jgi:hypothetical protein
MEKNQKINCTVETCMYNNSAERKCTLGSIQVSPVANCNTKETSESKCSSYKYEE